MTQRVCVKHAITLSITCCWKLQAARTAAEEQAAALRAELEQALEAQGKLRVEAQEGASREQDLLQLREGLQQRDAQLQVRRGGYHLCHVFVGVNGFCDLVMGGHGHYCCAQAMA
jgi:hypothetical protein